MRTILLFLTACMAFGPVAQAQVLSPAAQFNLNAPVKPNHFGKNARPFFAATPNGLTLVTIGPNGAAIASTDLDGRILHFTTDLVSVNAAFNGALPRPDGSVWLISGGPLPLIGPVPVPFASAAPPDDSSTRIDNGISSERTNWTELDLYSPAGGHLDSMRVLNSSTHFESPVAAGRDQIVLRSDFLGKYSLPTVFTFGAMADHGFKPQTEVKVPSPVPGGISLLDSNGNLILIVKRTGEMLVIDPRTNAGPGVHLATALPVRAAATDEGYLYLLSGDSVQKADLAGQVLSTYRLNFGRAFLPAALGVTGKSIYLVDTTGNTERFQLN